MNIMDFSEANCHQCYKCIRSCQVKAISMIGDQASIVKERCIVCGQCFYQCPQNARNIHSDLDSVKEMIERGERVTVSLAPSYRGFFEEHKELIGSLKGLGFHRIEETALGAEITTRLYSEYIEETNDEVYITTCCPTVVLLIEKYYPKLIKYLMPFNSPMIVHGKLIKKDNKDEKVVFIGPCVTKKHETITPKNKGIIDAVLTFDEVATWIEEKNPQKVQVEDNYIEPSLGNKYPLLGGIIEGIKESLNKRRITSLVVDGIEECREILEEIQNENLSGVCIEMSGCKNSCLGGPGGGKLHASSYIKVKRARESVGGSIEKKDATKERELFETTFIDKSTRDKMPSQERIYEILRSMGKFREEEYLNCGCCGYSTCREKAISIYQGMSHRDMCIHYIKFRNEKISNEIFDNSPSGILILDGNYKVLESNVAFSHLFGLRPEEVKEKRIDEVEELNPIVSDIKENNEIFWEKRNFERINLFMRVTIVMLEERNAYILIFTDITSEEFRSLEIRALQEKTLTITQKVIEKQMVVAQEIASLLGETTAETKVALNKVRDVFKKEEI